MVYESLSEVSLKTGKSINTLWSKDYRLNTLTVKFIRYLRVSTSMDSGQWSVESISGLTERRRKFTYGPCHTISR